MNQRDPYWGLLRRRGCLLPTWPGLLLLVLLGVAILLEAALLVQPFLAPTVPVPAEILVVEGWVPDYVLAATAAEFKRGHYRRLYVTGGPLETGGFLSQYRNFAEHGAAILAGMGISKGMIEAVPAPSVRRDRTYTSALALKSRLQQQNTSVTGINLVSLGVHSRRSRLLFQEVFGAEPRVGIIAVENRSYDPAHWWRYSNGVRAVVDELAAYIYALVVFPLLEA